VRVNFLFLFVVTAFFLSLSASAADPDLCLSASDTSTGKSCTDGARKMDVKVRNQCGEPMDVRICIGYGAPEKWNCGLNFAVPSNAEMNSSSCNATGNFKFWGRKPKSMTQFPNEYGDVKKVGDKLYVTAYGETQEAACRRAKAVDSIGESCECEETSPAVFQCRSLVKSIPANLQSRVKDFGSVAANQALVYADD